jgi:hypothetical protein
MISRQRSLRTAESSTASFTSFSPAQQQPRDAEIRQCRDKWDSSRLSHDNRIHAFANLPLNPNTI